MNADERVRARSESQPSPVKKSLENSRMVVSLMGVSELYKRNRMMKNEDSQTYETRPRSCLTRYRDSHDLKGRHGGADKTGSAGLWPCSAMATAEAGRGQIARR
jgi:hypothetical protein